MKSLPEIPFYDLSKEARAALVASIQKDFIHHLENDTSQFIQEVFCNKDTYIRKSGYLVMGKIYKSHPRLRNKILEVLNEYFESTDELVRQTVINAAGEIGKYDFEIVQSFFDRGLFDVHHAPRNAVIGSIKKMGEVNPMPVLHWAKTYLKHPNVEIRREICHGIELRGREHPEEILPLLQTLQHDKIARVRKTLVHVIGQIAYKPGCLATVIDHLNTWENRQLVLDALEEIIDVHHRYRNFSALTQEQARAYIKQNAK